MLSTNKSHICSCALGTEPDSGNVIRFLRVGNRASHRDRQREKHELQPRKVRRIRSAELALASRLLRSAFKPIRLQSEV